MSRVWDALQRIEQQRQDDVWEFVVPDRIWLTPKQQLAVQALLQCDSLAEAACLTGVAEVTLRRWLTRPGFITAFYLAGREQLELERARLDAATDKAIDKLRHAREALVKLSTLAHERRCAAPAAVVDNGAPPAEGEG